MQFYGISVTPIIHQLRKEVKNVSQVWLADDATGAGKLDDLKKWWDTLAREGHKYGYYVKPSKSWIILKDPTKIELTQDIFADTTINITTDGKRHLGAALGSHNHKENYISEKVSEWCQNITRLSDIAKSQPHAAYAAFIHGEQHKYTYFMRTIGGISNFLEPLDEVINNLFIPALFGRELDEAERKVLELPIKEGGLGLRNISSRADLAYEASKEITQPLTNQIISQSENLPNIRNVEETKSKVLEEVGMKNKTYKDNIVMQQTDDMKRRLEQLSEPGASSWIGALPIKEYGFALNRGEFNDALNLRYNKNPKNLPAKCVCGSVFTITHALNCHKGGFINARHDSLRNMDAQLLSTVCTDVECEPQLLKVENPETLGNSANKKDDARLDIRARGFWRQCQNAFFDIRVTNADSESQRNSPMKSILRKHELEKKRCYNRRVMEIEHGTFTPLVFTTTGVMSHECQSFHKTLAEKIAAKKGERYDDVIRYIRMKISFLVLHATLLCIRGSRSWHSKYEDHDAEDFGMKLIAMKAR